MQKERGLWSSKTGFILAAAGSAIGLGNIWRFPYIAGENGGAAFVLIYRIRISSRLPYMLAEFSLGRAFQLNTVGAIDKIKPNSFWRYTGILGIITSIGILSFYGVIAGWTFGYIFKSFTASSYEGAAGFSEFVSNPFYEIFLIRIFYFFDNFNCL